MSDSSSTQIKETHCLNCGSPLTGKYCAQCGQKAHMHKDSFWHMAAHFIGDYFHYDSKFWTTIKSLFTRPGEATLEFIEGKRAKYLNPIQLYIFVVTIFVLVTLRAEEDDASSSDSQAKTEKTSSDSTGSAQQINDSVFTDSLEISLPVPADTEDTANKKKRDTHLGISTVKGKNIIGLGPWTPEENSVEAYDSVQQSLPESERDGMLKRATRRKALSYNTYSPEAFEKMYWQAFRYNFPKVLFCLLPFFAFLLKIFFWGSKRYYVDHIVFSLHYHSMLFLMINLDFLAVAIWDNVLFDDILGYLLLLGSTAYLFLSLKRVYQNPTWLVLIKQLFIFLIYLLTFIFAMLVLLYITFLFL